MSKYKTEFELRDIPSGKGAQTGIIRIWDDRLRVETISGTRHYMNPKDLERFAVNILRALNSPRLKQQP